MDRLFAIWQGLHDLPSARDPYVSSQVTATGTFITTARTREDSKTPLAPFYKDSANFWDSEGVRTTKIFGYAYPETQDWLYGNGAAYRASIVENLRRVYSEGSFVELVRADKAGSADASRLLRDRAETLLQVAKADAPSNTVTLLQVADQRAPPAEGVRPIADISAPVSIPSVELPADRDLGKLVPSDRYLEWLVNIKAQKYVLGGDFTVHVFLGPVEEDNSVLYPASPNHVGTFSTFGQDEDTSVSKTFRLSLPFYAPPPTSPARPSPLWRHYHLASPTYISYS